MQCTVSPCPSPQRQGPHKKKLLALDLKATTAKMLEVCQTHIAISDILDAIGLAGSKPIHAIHQGNHKKQCQQQVK